MRICFNGLPSPGFAGEGLGVRVFGCLDFSILTRSVSEGQPRSRFGLVIIQQPPHPRPLSRKAGRGEKIRMITCPLCKTEAARRDAAVPAVPDRPLAAGRLRDRTSRRCSTRPTLTAGPAKSPRRCKRIWTFWKSIRPMPRLGPPLVRLCSRLRSAESVGRPKRRYWAAVLFAAVVLVAFIGGFLLCLGMAYELVSQYPLPSK